MQVIAGASRQINSKCQRLSKHLASTVDVQLHAVALACCETSVRDTSKLLDNYGVPLTSLRLGVTGVTLAYGTDEPQAQTTPALRVR